MNCRFVQRINIFLIAWMNSKSEWRHYLIIFTILRLPTRSNIFWSNLIIEINDHLASNSQFLCLNILFIICSGTILLVVTMCTYTCIIDLEPTIVDELRIGHTCNSSMLGSIFSETRNLFSKICSKDTHLYYNCVSSYW